MAAAKSFPLILIVTATAIVSSTLWPVASALITPGEALITETCSKTMYPDLCDWTLKSDPQGLSSDVAGLAAISIRVAHDDAVSTSTYIADLHNSGGLTPLQLQNLNDCSENYGDAVDLLGDSVGALLDLRYTDVNAWLTAAMSDVDSCEKTSSGSVADLSQRNFHLSQLCTNALILTKLITDPNS